MSLVRSTPSGRPAGAFTLLEVIVSAAIFLVILLLLAGVFGDVNKVWLNGSARMSAMQNGRAILDFIARDLRSVEPPRPTVRIPGKAFFAQNYAIQGLDPIPVCYQQFLVDAGQGTSGLQDYLPSDQTVVANSGNFFGQMHGEITDAGDLWIVGYYLADGDDGVRRLHRVLVPPSAGASAYKLFQNAQGITDGNDPENSWIYNPAIFEEFDPATGWGASAIAENVAAFWITPLDGAGEPIPWLRDHDLDSAPLKFDSAARFQMPRGIAALAASQDGEPTFTFLDAGSSPKPLAAHELPAALRITLVATDDSYRKRGVPLPDPPALSGPDGAAAAAAEYQLTLYEAGQRQVTTLTTTVELPTRN